MGQGSARSEAEGLEMCGARGPRAFSTLEAPVAGGDNLADRVRGDIREQG